MEDLEAGGEKLGADAILSIDIDYETVGDNMLMVAASGTAVKLGQGRAEAPRRRSFSNLR